MMFEPPTIDAQDGFAHSLYVNSLPQVRCAACERLVGRRKHRVAIRSSWRENTEHLCPQCWAVVCEWAARFALQQMELPI